MLSSRMMNAVLRKTQAADFENLMRLYAQFEPKGTFDGLPPLRSSDIERWLRRIESKNCEQFVIEIGVRIVGHSILQWNDARTESELKMFIHQDFRGLGLGRRLLMGVLNHACRQLHLSRVWVRVPSNDPAIQEDLERVGFHASDLNEIFNGEFDMERTSNCPECKGERCAIFNRFLPATVEVPRTYW
jgi:RimJ/RimL family protein N-acetyltransferase